MTTVGPTVVGGPLATAVTGVVTGGVGATVTIEVPVVGGGAVVGGGGVVDAPAAGVSSTGAMVGGSRSKEDATIATSANPIAVATTNTATVAAIPRAGCRGAGSKWGVSRAVGSVTVWLREAMVETPRLRTMRTG